MPSAKKKTKPAPAKKSNPMPVAKKAMAKAKKSAVKVAPKKAPDKNAAVKKPTAKKAALQRSAPKKAMAAAVPSTARKYTLYIESCAFFPANSADGYVDLFQEGRHALTPDKSLMAPVVIPVGAKLLSISIHYMNTTTEPVMGIFLRKHANRHSPSGEIEMSFISLTPGTLPPDNFLTVTDDSFPDGNIIQDKFLHYIEIGRTGDFGKDGKRTIRGISLVYSL